MKRITLGDRHHRIPASVFKSPDDLGQALAREILSAANDASAAGRKFLLGCPGGRSLRSTYQRLGRLAGQEQADLSGLVLVMMNDYVRPGNGGYIHCPAEAHYSCRRFALREVRDVLNADLPPEKRIASGAVWLPCPSNPEAYDQRIADAGGVDLFLLACGASDGNVAFNSPGSTLDSRSRVVRLGESTRRDNMASFPNFTGIDDVPAHGVTIGLGAIVEHARRAVLVIHGADKTDAACQLASLGDFSADWPASLIFRCRNPQVMFDESAARTLLARNGLSQPLAPSF